MSLWDAAFAAAPAWYYPYTWAAKQVSDSWSSSPKQEAPLRQPEKREPPPPPAPPPAWVNNPSANMQSEFRTDQDQLYPGYGEEYWYQNQNQFAPGGNAQGFFDQSSSMFGQPGAGEQYWNGVAGNQGPQATAFAWNRANPQLSQPGAVSDYWGSVGGAFQDPTKSSQYSDWASPQLMGPGAVQSYGAGALPQFQQPTASQGQYASSAGALAGPTDSQYYANRNVPGLGAPTASEQYFASAVPQLDNQPHNAQAVFDQFQAAPPGMDAYYDEAKTRAAEDINRSLAASGMLGSSYGAQAQTDAMVQLNAEQANREADYRLQQAATAGQLARGADIGATDYFRTGGALAGQADDARLAAMGLGGELVGQADQTRLAQELGLGQLAGMSDEQRLAYLMGGGDLAQGMSSEELARLGMGAEFAGQADQSWLARTMGGADVASQADADLLARMGLLGDLGSRYDQNDLARTLGLGGLAFNAQGAALDRQGQGFGQALGLDSFGLEEATAGMGAATTAQGLYDNRIQQNYENQLQLAMALNGVYGPAYSDMFGSDQQLMDSTLAAQVGRAYQDYMAGLAQQQQGEQGIMNGVGMVTDLYSMRGRG